MPAKPAYHSQYSNFSSNSNILLVRMRVILLTKRTIVLGMMITRMKITENNNLASSSSTTTSTTSKLIVISRSRMMTMMMALIKLFATIRIIRV